MRCVICSPFCCLCLRRAWPATFGDRTKADAFLVDIVSQDWWISDVQNAAGIDRDRGQPRAAGRTRAPVHEASRAIELDGTTTEQRAARASAYGDDDEPKVAFSYYGELMRFPIAGSV